MNMNENGQRIDNQTIFSQSSLEFKKSGTFVLNYFLSCSIA